MRDWDFARLTHDAAEAGGVDQYIETIRQAGFSEGRSSMYPWIPVAVGAGYLLKLAYDKAANAYRSWKENEESLRREEEIAKVHLEKMYETRSTCEEEEATHD